MRTCCPGAAYNIKRFTVYYSWVLFNENQRYKNEAAENTITGNRRGSEGGDHALHTECTFAHRCSQRQLLPATLLEVTGEWVSGTGWSMVWALTLAPIEKGTKLWWHWRALPDYFFCLEIFAYSKTHCHIYFWFSPHFSGSGWVF